MRRFGEPLAFFGDSPERVRFGRFLPGSLLLRSYDGRRTYLEGTDYRADPDQGTVRRIPGSAIPDLSDHPFSHVDRFDHTVVDAFSMEPFTILADYRYAGGSPVGPDGSPAPSSREVARASARPIPSEAWQRMSSRQDADGPLRLLVYGDSISTGGEASCPERTFFNRFAHRLERFLGRHVEVWNGSRGGDTSEDGVRRLEEDAVPHLPDLCLIAFGMNDQNVGNDDGHFVSPRRFLQNIVEIADRIRSSAPDCLFVLITPCLPHPRWRWTSDRPQVYAETLRGLADKDHRFALADAQRVWEAELAAGKRPETLLLNHINHPNDYGHGVYADALVSLLPADADQEVEA